MSTPISTTPGPRPVVWGLAFSNAGAPLLESLRQAGVVQHWVGPAASPSPQQTLQANWEQASGFVIVGACGLVTRLVAPLLRGKSADPAVVVLDGQGSFAIPLLGGHQAGAERLSHSVAAVLGSQVVLTGSSGSEGRLALDAFGEAWGWRRGPSGDWSALVQKAVGGAPIAVAQTSGNRRWQKLCAATHCTFDNPADFRVTAQRGPGCRWHPPSLWLGLGCERGTSQSLVERLVREALETLQLAPEAIAGLASIDRKADEEALLAIAAQRGWDTIWLPAATLAGVAVPNPSPVVAQEMGTASVAEASALWAAGPKASLLLPKTIGRPEAGERGAATLAIAAAAEQWAPQRGALHLVGSGPGRLDLLTPDARRALAEATVWVGYGLYLDLLEPLRRPDQLRSDGRLTEERARCAQALELANQGLNVALVSSGDSGIYAMAGLALELWLAQSAQQRPSFEVHPGISALQMAAARAGAPLMHDFCTISLSDRLTPWAVVEQRLKAAASGDFVVALYNPRSLGREWQLGRAQELLLAGRPASTPVVLARQLGRPEEVVSLHSLGGLPIGQVDMLTLVLIGNSSSYAQDGRMLTPRGYPGSEFS